MGLMHLVCGINQSHSFILFYMYVSRDDCDETAHKQIYATVQLNLCVMHLECGYNQTTISYYLFVDREGSDETAHLRSLV